MKVRVTPQDFQTLKEKSLALAIFGERADDGSIPRILKESAARFGDTYCETSHRDGEPVTLLVVWDAPPPSPSA